MIPEETPAVQNITPVETPAVPETPAAPVDEQQYEYVEVPADQVPADAQQYEYVEVPADQAVQDFGVEKLDELEETPTVENVTPAPATTVEDITPAETITEPDVATSIETVTEPETVAPPAAAVAPAAPAETYDFASLEMPETAAPTVEDITPVEAITEPDVAAPAAPAAVENITPVEAITEPETDAPTAAAAPAAVEAQTLQKTLETPETETVIDGGAQSLTPEDKIYSAEELETPEVENITPVETVAEPETVTPAETVTEPDVTAPVAPVAPDAPTVENITPVEAITELETVAVPAAPAAAQIAEETQEELDPPEISDTLSAPAPDVEAAAMQETADMTQQAETAQEIFAGETAEIENVPPAETVAEPETVVPPAASVVPDAPVAPAAQEGFVFKDGDGQKSFTAESAAQSVTIDTADLSRWMIVLNQISVSPVEAAAGQQIELSPDMYCQGQLIGATGDVMPFANMANVPVPEFSPDPVQSATLFFSGVSIIPLANQGGVTMDLGGANGVVVNTNGDMLYFANLSALTLIETPAPVAETTAPATTNAPDAPPATVAVPAAPAATIPAYAFAPVPAPLNDAVVFSADSESAQVDGNDGKPHILVKANDRLLGWHVDFAAAGRMSLADVKAYQAAHGDLPEHDGVLTFKDKSLTFKNILSIRVFETPAYCGYGIAPAF